MLYLGTSKHNISYFNPMTHQENKRFLSATCLYPFALSKCCDWDDFDFLTILSRDELILFECRPEAFKQIFSEKSGSVYVFNSEEFRAVGPRVEYRTNQIVSPIAELYIYDVATSLQMEQIKHTIKIHSFEQNDEYKSKILNHIQNILDRNNLSMLDMVRKDERFHAIYGMWLELQHVNDTQRKDDSHVG